MKRFSYYENGHARVKLDDTEYRGAVADALARYENAEEQGNQVFLPVPIGGSVYIIAESLKNCDNCVHRAEAILKDRSGSKICPGFVHKNYRCAFVVQKRKVDAYILLPDAGGKPEVFPCETPINQGREPVYSIRGVDNRWYATEEEAKASLPEVEFALRVDEGISPKH